jgi:transposase-like protein
MLLGVDQQEMPMNPHEVFCPNLACPARGRVGEGNITLFSRKEKRCGCAVCEKTFSVTKGSLFYRLRTAPATVMLVIALLTYGCPPKAAALAFDLDERTVRDWWKRTGKQSEAVHEHLVVAQPRDLQQVQADEIRAKLQKAVAWLAMAIEVPTRLWLGGVVRPRRDTQLITQLAEIIRRQALCRPLLLAVDGLASYVAAFQQAFRSPMPSVAGRPRLVAWPDIAIVQVIKRKTAERLEIERRIVQGAEQLVRRLIQASQGHGGINTAFIERLNATFRQHLAPLARRTRALARQTETLAGGMYVVGCVYNFCTYHQSLRLVGSFGYRWVQRTPAMAAKLTDHCWTIPELLSYRVPPPRWVPPAKRGRPSNEQLALIERWAK